MSEDDLLEWELRLYDFDPTEPLGAVRISLSQVACACVPAMPLLVACVHVLSHPPDLN